MRIRVNLISFISKALNFADKHFSSKDFSETSVERTHSENLYEYYYSMYFIETPTLKWLTKNARVILSVCTLYAEPR